MNRKIPIDITEVEEFYRVDEDGAIWSYNKKKYLKPTFNTAGYLFVSITTRNYYRRFISVHRLVAAKYIGECPPELETSHKDGNKQNNHCTNLEYLTHSQNILKSYREHNRSRECLYYPRHPHSDATKELMSNAKKKRVRHTVDGTETIYPSIEDAHLSLNIDRKIIYYAIRNKTELKSKCNPNLKGFLSFVDV